MSTKPRFRVLLAHVVSRPVAVKTFLKRLASDCWADRISHFQMFATQTVMAISAMVHAQIKVHVALGQGVAYIRAITPVKTCMAASIWVMASTAFPRLVAVHVALTAVIAKTCPRSVVDKSVELMRGTIRVVKQLHAYCWVDVVWVAAHAWMSSVPMRVIRSVEHSCLTRNVLQASVQVLVVSTSLIAFK
jgi:hypothetical protein